MAHVYRGTNSREDRNPILYGMARCYAARVQEWYYRLREMSRLTMSERAEDLSLLSYTVYDTWFNA
jgi:hypothetical protein